VNTAITGEFSYAPFGETFSKTNSAAASFTGQNQDIVPCLYDFLCREYSPVMGHWISPAVDRGHLEIWESVEQAIEIDNMLGDSTVGLSSVWATVEWETFT
jgi:RHS repeat-associated protein